MIKKNRIFIIIVAALFIVLMIIEGTRKKPVDWRYSFSGNDKIPYGSYVLRDLLKNIYPERKFIDYNEGVYMYSKYNGFPENSAFIFITKNFVLDKLDFERLLSFVKKGNDVFVSAEDFSKNIMDTLNFRTTFDWKNTVDSSKKAHLNFYNPVLKSDTGYTILNVFSEFTLNSTDGKPTSVLATDNNQNAKLIRIQRGKGNIFISTTPLLFTNYNILYGNYRYPFVALSYLRGNSIVWDEFYKPNKPEVSSPLRYILTQPALTAAYYLLMIAILFYLLFRGKRKQRVIPVILPHGNLSLEFANTLGQLYFNNGNNKDIALKKYNHFCDYLRNKFFVKNMSDDDEFCRQLSESSGVDFITVSHIFKYARIINSHAWTSDEELIYFNSKIEEFYNKTK